MKTEQEPDFEKKLEFLARGFFEDCKDDEGYPSQDWEDQRDEMRSAVSKEFVESYYQLNKEHFAEVMCEGRK